MKKKAYLQPHTDVLQMENVNSLCAGSVQLSDEAAWEDACGKENFNDDESWGDISY